jgi:hypothetical protein
MDTNCKSIHAHAYTVPRSVEQQLQQSKEIVRLVDIGVLEEDYSSEWASRIPSFVIIKKKGTIRVVTDFRNNYNSTQLIWPLCLIKSLLFCDLEHQQIGTLNK